MTTPYQVNQVDLAEYITDNPDLTPEARAWMRQLGEYADPYVRTQV